MTNTIEFFFDFVSPASYLAWKRLPAVAARCGAAVRHVPMFLGGVMQATGNRPPATVPAKGAYMLRDLQRTAAHDGVAFAFNPHFPVNSLPLVRIATALLDDARYEPFVAAAFEAMWAQPVDLGDAAVVVEVLDKAGLDGAGLLALADAPAVKQATRENTDEAVRRGAFGAPTFFVGDEMFFGQDRLDWVEQACA